MIEMSVGNYTQAERKIVYQIKDIQTKQAHCRKHYLDLDVQKLALIHLLKGKYNPGSRKKIKKSDTNVMV